ncbi:excalibur calcium-binding domain-containing protein [Mycobacterium sp.]
MQLGGCAGSGRYTGQRRLRRYRPGLDRDGDGIACE